MNTAAGESYQDRVRYYRQQAEQARTNKSRQKWSRQGRKNQSGKNDGVNVDFDEALYNFKHASGFDKLYSRAKRHAKRHAFDNLSFYRDDEQGYVGGVCAGIADKMNWDVTTVRVVTVVLGLIFTLPTLIAYIAGTVFLRKKNLAFYGRDEHNFWKSAAHGSTKSNETQADAEFTSKEII